MQTVPPMEYFSLGVRRVFSLGGVESLTGGAGIALSTGVVVWLTGGTLFAAIHATRCCGVSLGQRWGETVLTSVFTNGAALASTLLKLL